MGKMSFGKAFLHLTAVSAFFVCSIYCAAPKDNTLHLSLQQLHAQLDQMQYLLQSQRVEIDLLQEKNQEISQNCLQFKQNVEEQSHIDRTLHKEQLAPLEKRLAVLEKMQESTISDLQQFKVRINETASSITLCQAKISELDKQIGQEMRNLKKNMESLVQLIQKPKHTLAINEEQTLLRNYKVQPGDSLGKIALENNSDIKTLKELNQLANDTIYVGQHLQLPLKK